MNIPLEMISRCLEAHRLHASDTEAESVLADWAEETGFGGLAAGLRIDSPNVRWSTLADFVRMIDPSWLTKSHDAIEQAQRAAQAQFLYRQSLDHHRNFENEVADELVRDTLVRQHQENAARRAEIVERSLQVIAQLSGIPLPHIIEEGSLEREPKGERTDEEEP